MRVEILAVNTQTMSLSKKPLEGTHQPAINDSQKPAPSAAERLSACLPNPAAKALFKAVYAATRVEHLLFSGIKWMTAGTNIKLDVLTQSGTRFHHVPATACRCNFFVFWMYILFHEISPDAAATRFFVVGHRITRQTLYFWAHFVLVSLLI